MAQQHVIHKLAAILAADVAGYSRLMGEDEAATLDALMACRSIIDQIIAEHHGRVFGSAGDSVVAEFPSAVEAVICAREVQERIADRNAQGERGAVTTSSVPMALILAQTTAPTTLSRSRII